MEIPLYNKGLTWNLGQGSAGHPERKSLRGYVNGLTSRTFTADTQMLVVCEPDGDKGWSRVMKVYGSIHSMGATSSHVLFVSHVFF